jgi:hypothetical protein
MKKLLCALAVLIAVPVAAQEREEEDVRVIVRGGHGGHGGHEALPPLPPPPPEPPMGAPTYGIPPHVAEKLGLPQNIVQKVQDLSFDANDKLIGLEADLKRAQLQLDRELRQPNPNESTVMQLVEKVGGAETAVRKNRVGLMVAIKKAVGPEYWPKLEAELGPLGGMGGPRRFRIERRIEGPGPRGPDAPPPPPAPERKR